MEFEVAFESEHLAFVFGSDHLIKCLATLELKTPKELTYKVDYDVVSVFTSYGFDATPHVHLSDDFKRELIEAVQKRADEILWDYENYPKAPFITPEDDKT